MLADAIALHDEALTFGGREGTSSLHLIQSGLARPYSGYHHRIDQKCAALLHSMVGNHGFVDANKLTARLPVELPIDRGGYVLGIPDDAPVDDLVVQVASGELGYADLAGWFRARLVRSIPV
ncbi:hypothetical protein FNJ84_18065 [Paracoccus sp. M683]|uniref:type II toxin-antitoxin system death-on-curing family toxin n=1 Tax=Paracoccus sp. M683 TaxID=2594268 RepID=UPI00117EC315|nr:hypothetical protein [Paracoccus sp. M683]TRW94773.1 hypothetical protein FNJ84_18065 [Paracoccus sp. M683]